MVLVLFRSMSQSIQTFVLPASLEDGPIASDRGQWKGPATIFFSLPLFTLFPAKLSQPNLPQFFRSGSILIYVRAYLLWTSLMARVSTLGPSDAPRSGEPSTVHGAAFFWVESFCMAKFKTLVFIFSAPVFEGFKTLKLPSFPATMSPSPTIDSLQRSRRPTSISRTCKQKLGLQRVALFLICGPIALFRSNFELSGSHVGLGKILSSLEMIFNGLDPNSQLQNSSPALPTEKASTFAYGHSISPALQRSELLSSCSQLFDWFSRFIVLLELGHHPSLESLILVRYCVQLSRTLYASSSRLWSEELFDTKDITSTAPVSFLLGLDHYYRVKYFKCNMPAYTFCDHKVTLPFVASSLKLQIQFPQPCIIRYLSDLEGQTNPLHLWYKNLSLEQCSSLEKLLLPSSDMERTLLPSFTWLPTFKVRNRPRFLSTSSWFVPATFEAKESFSTSHDLLIVTTCNLPELFAEVSLTHHDLACGMLLSSLCLRVFMTLSSQLIAYFIVWFSFRVSLFPFTFIMSHIKVEELVIFVSLYWV